MEFMARAAFPTGCKSRYLHPLVIVAAVTVVCIPLILIGPQSGHSLGHNVSWASGFTGQLLGGELYPRWLIDMNEGAGSPAFFFYAPLPFYLMAPAALVCQGCDVNIVVGITEWLIFVLSGLAFYLFARRHAAPLASTIGSVLYALLPYHFVIDLLVRQSLGEIAAYIWMPLALHFTSKMKDDRYAVVGFAVAYSLLILSHLPAALLFSMFLLLYAANLAWQNRSPGQFYAFLSGVLLGIALAGVYIVPALLSQDNISAGEWWTPYFQYDQWFFLDGVDTPNPEFSKSLFLILLITTGVFARVWYIAYRQREARERNALFVWLSFVAGAWFLMTPVSWYLWQLLPFLQKVQFPWRVAIVIDLAVAITFVMALRDVPAGRNRQFVSIAGMAALLLIFSGIQSTVLYAGHWILSRDAEYQETLRTTISTGFDAAEYIPASVGLSQEEVLAYLKSAPRVDLDADRGQVNVVRWQARKLAFDVDLSSETRLTVRQFHYPGWRAWIADGGVTLTVTPSDPAGLLELVAPPGQYRLELELGRSRQETAGAVLSGAGLAVVLLLTAVRFARRRHRVNAILTVGRE
jgi:hypothetical protein